MKKTILSVLLLFIVTIANGQQKKLAFTYDGVGNRISREMQTVVLRAGAIADSTNIAVESLFNITIKVYPNPTQGQLTIEIEDFEIKTPLEMVVFDRSSQLLQRRTVKEPIIYLDLSSYPSAAWYIVAFIMNGERRDFKIIKL